MENIYFWNQGYPDLSRPGELRAGRATSPTWKPVRTRTHRFGQPEGGLALYCCCCCWYCCCCCCWHCCCYCCYCCCCFCCYCCCFLFTAFLCFSLLLVCFVLVLLLLPLLLWLSAGATSCFYCCFLLLKWIIVYKRCRKNRMKSPLITAGDRASKRSKLQPSVSICKNIK